MQPRIDNWGHLGGLVGGMLVALLFGPNLKPVKGKDGKVGRVVLAFTESCLDPRDGRLAFGIGCRCDWPTGRSCIGLCRRSTPGDTSCNWSRTEDFQRFRVESACRNPATHTLACVLSKLGRQRGGAIPRLRLLRQSIPIYISNGGVLQCLFPSNFDLFVGFAFVAL